MAPARITRPEQAGGNAAAGLSFVEPTEDDLFLVALDLDALQLSDDVDAYVHGDRLFLPFGLVCRLLDLAVTVEPERGIAEGFILQEERTFRLDLAARLVSMAGHVMPVERDRVELHHNDIYVDAQLLEAWLPVAFEVDRNAAIVRVHPREPLPMQERLERARRVTRLPAYQAMIDRGYPRIEAPYRLFAGPEIDQALSLSSGAGSPLAGASRGVPGLRYYGLMTADLLAMNAALQFSATDRGGAWSRLSLSRRDPDNRLLGTLGASEVSLGDVTFPNVPLVAPTDHVAGLVVGRFPLYQQSEFDAHTFQGDLAPGWDVELYRGSALMAYQAASADGRYEFRDIPLLFGDNSFRLVFHGPHGEERQEERRFFIGSSQARSGERDYRFAINGSASGPPAVAYLADFGLSANLAVSGSVTSLSLEDGPHRYAALGLQGFARGVCLHSNVAVDARGGWGEELGAQTRIGNASVAFSQARITHYTSALYPLEDATPTDQMLLRLDNIALPGWSRLQPMGLEVVRERYRSGERLARLTNRLSRRISSHSGALSLSNYLDGEARQTAAGTELRLDGTLVGSRRLGNLLARGEFDYGAAPVRVEGFTLGVTGLLPRARVVDLEVQYHHADGSALLKGRFSRTARTYTTGLDLGWSSHGDVALGWTVSMSAGHDPFARRWWAGARPQATRGAASVRVFLDTNRNGRWDAGERLLSGVRFFVNGRSYGGSTGADGTLLLGDLQSDRPTDVSLSESSLEDPLWVAGRAGVRIVPRPGAPVRVEFAVCPTAEISGTVYVRKKDAKTIAPGVTLRLIDAGGSMVQTVRSAYDGFYTISRVPEGSYTLRAEPPLRAKSPGGAPGPQGVDVGPPNEIRVQVPADGGFLDGMDVVLQLPSTGGEPR